MTLWLEWPLQTDQVPSLLPSLAHVAFHFPPPPSPLCIPILSVPSLSLWHCDCPQAMPLQRPFSVFVHLARSDSPLVAQFSVAWLGLRRGCRGETFLQMLWDGLLICVPGSGCGIFCSKGVSPRGQKAPRRKQVATFRCKYSQTDSVVSPSEDD